MMLLRLRKQEGNPRRVSLLTPFLNDKEGVPSLNTTCHRVGAMQKPTLPMLRCDHPPATEKT